MAAGYLAITTKVLVAFHPNGAAAVFAGIAYALLFGAIAPALTPMWISPRVVDAVSRNRPCENSVLASAGYHEPSLVFMAGTKTVLTDTEGAARHLLADPACAMALVPAGDGDRLRNLLMQAGKTANRLALVNGINYSSGDTLSLALYDVSH
jgi:hypothetical protein